MSTEPPLGSDDLEKGMRPGRASDAAVIGLIAVVLLLVFNSGGLVKWTEALPSHASSIWLSKQAGWWHRRMTRLGPSLAFETLRTRVRGP